jgi:hypothetical protein
MQLTKADYEAVWPTLTPKIKQLVHNVSHGRGFQFIKYAGASWECWIGFRAVYSLRRDLRWGILDSRIESESESDQCSRRKHHSVTLNHVA